MYKFVSERIKYDHFFANTYLHVAEKNKNKYFLKEDEINSNNVSDLSSSENVGISNTAGSSSRGSSSDTSVSGTDNVVGDKVNVKDKEFKISRALVYTVKYEELQKDEKGTMHKLYTWLNIPYIGKNIKFIKVGNIFCIFLFVAFIITVIIFLIVEKSSRRFEIYCGELWGSRKV